MKRWWQVVVVFIALLLAWLTLIPRRLPEHVPAARAAPLQPVSAALATPAAVNPAVVRSDVAAIHQSLGNFLTLVKESYRPPLGDNTDIATALSGGNRLHEIYIPTNDPSFRDGKLVDRWGTPYWFHPRAPDAIDVRSAGPDKTLFTPDDISQP